ncbi:Uncharacterized protein FWK35_00008266 [Aphis craccivora]|uniref:Uncharacterized protein n=1 Tax=Aphis craccivora TaxID=307492 RepID=A0A6G0Z3C7_APHCR|nr:Uncharacterized protein FWK35_00008266 [Aphis craccivora]
MGSRCFSPDRYFRVCVPVTPHTHPPTRKRPGRHLSRVLGVLRFHTTHILLHRIIAIPLLNHHHHHLLFNHYRPNL